MHGGDVRLEVSRLGEGCRTVLALEGLYAEVHSGDMRLKAVRPGKGRRTVLALEGLQAEVRGIIVPLACAATAEEDAALHARVAGRYQVRRRVVNAVLVVAGRGGRRRRCIGGRFAARAFGSSRSASRVRDSGAA